MSGPPGTELLQNIVSSVIRQGLLPGMEAMQQNTIHTMSTQHAAMVNAQNAQNAQNAPSAPPVQGALSGAAAQANLEGRQGQRRKFMVILTPD